MRIFITGASGCIGHYIVDTLMQQTDHELFLLVRQPDKLRLDLRDRPNVHLVKGDMQDIGLLEDLLATIDVAILTAAAWGGMQETFDINVTKTVKLVNSLNPAVCQQVIYFSTESILGRDNQLLKQAGQIGTDYVRTKYLCFQELSQSPLRDRITTVFPTLVLGGDGQKPYSHISGGLPDVVKWINLARWFRVDGSFHFVHAQDIATVVCHLVDHPPPEPGIRKMVLGTPAMSADEFIEAVCAYLHKRIWFRIPLSAALANFLVTVLGLEMAAWDRFCMNYRHFVHDNPVSPASFGLPVYCQSVADVLRLRGIPGGKG